ncbi:MAG: nitroreductase family protein [Oscillospiraceae bacterium]|nr:nitroreductase family protein [Oscillospiraceae bacterium]
MEFLEMARNRYSERSFAATPLEEEKLYKILEAGRIAPTACNNQPQRFYVLKSAGALTKAAKLTHTYHAPVVILVCYVEADAWHNPRDGFVSGDMDASIAASSMMFEAEDLGIHSIWLRGFDAKAVQETFELPDGTVPSLMLALGYPGENAGPHRLHKEREPMEEFVVEL